MKENLIVTGHLFAIAENINTGKIVQVIDHKNQIVNGLLSTIADFLADSTTHNITQISFGTNTDTPTRTDTASVMENRFVKSITGTPTKPAYNQVQYEFTLDPLEHNGYDITEYALTLDNNNIVSRITRGIVKKTDNIRISGNWTITIGIGA